MLGNATSSHDVYYFDVVFHVMYASTMRVVIPEPAGATKLTHRKTAWYPSL